MSEYYTKSQTDTQASVLGQRIKQAVAGVPKSIIPIWAEENGALADNQYEWSFGNGAVGATIGIVIPFNCELFAVSLNAEVAGTSITMHTKNNNVNIHTSTHTGQNSFETLTTPIAFSAGDKVSFQTGTLSGTWSDARVCAWFREL